MKLEQLQYLECQLCDLISESFDSMPDNGTTEWDLRKLDLINKVMNELSNIEVEV
jgi:hypothetical protein|uniref:Uncharacterized protein n=1 Tax=Caudovirales sp. ctTqA28 TaxID=2826775 RepID=A0A8S5MDI0_9CAUD|nr:MAG TPA: hypothetical protein [Caudovirales sp. ctTqA28]